MAFRFTEEHLEDIERCRSDVRYFLSKYCLANMYAKSSNYEYLVDCYINHDHFNGVFTDRGFTFTLLTGIVLHKSMFNPYSYTSIHGPNHSGGVKLLDCVMGMNGLLPEWLRLPVKVNNKRHIEFENGSSLFSVGSGVPVGMCINMMICDQFYLMPYGKRNDLIDYVRTFMVKDVLFTTTDRI